MVNSRKKRGKSNKSYEFGFSVKTQTLRKSSGISIFFKQKILKKNIEIPDDLTEIYLGQKVIYG